MTPDDRQQLDSHVRAIAQILHSDAQAKGLPMESLEDIYSPYLEKCCLRMCAKTSYQHAEADVSMLTGLRVSAKTQERMVKRTTLPEPSAAQPVNELTLDGGMVRVRTPKGEASVWRQYHGIRVNGNGIGMAWYKNPVALLAWVTTLNAQAASRLP